MHKILLVIAFTLIVGGLYFVTLPLQKTIELKIAQIIDPTDGLRYRGTLSERQDNIDRAKLLPIPKDNRLVIPAIGIDAPIVEGSDEDALQHGVWRRPRSSAPDAGGNTVITAHRFMRNMPEYHFYHLNKLKVGDKLIVFWRGEEFVYEIFETFRVNRNRTDIENQSDKPIITLYTCDLFDEEVRLVVQARLLSRHRPQSL